MKARRGEWKAEQPKPESAKPVFLDETRPGTNTTRTHGRCPQGGRLVMDVPHGHWKTTTFPVAPTFTGPTAPVVVDGPVNGDLFTAYIERHLVPTLRPGGIVVMDNLGSHKRVGVRLAIEAAEAELVYLPPCSPDLNPVGKAFGKLRALARKEVNRTVAALENFPGEVVDCYSPGECTNYYRSCGYATITREPL